LQPWQLDPTWWLIWTMEKTGLAWDVQRVSSQEIEGKLRPSWIGGSRSDEPVQL
jgi:hypothetical protein